MALVFLVRAAPPLLGVAPAFLQAVLLARFGVLLVFSSQYFGSVFSRLAPVCSGLPAYSHRGFLSLRGGWFRRKRTASVNLRAINNLAWRSLADRNVESAHF